MPTQTKTVDLEQLATERYRMALAQRSRLSRGMQIIRHYRWAQIGRRVLQLGKQKLFRQAIVGASEISGNLSLREQQRSSALAKIVIGASGESAQAVLGDLQNGYVTRLNQRVHLGWPIDWSVASHQTHLWRFQLHYHEFLLPIAAAANDPNIQPESSNAIQTVLNSWLDQFPPESTQRTDDAWHPYCISRRLPVWIWLLAQPWLPSELSDRMTTSLFLQTRYLDRQLELDLGGNHLMENLTALALAATVLGHADSEKWLTTAAQRTTKQLTLQILPHGEHYELSPMYHCQILSNLLRLTWMCRETRPDFSEICRGAATKMLQFLQLTCHPDGEIALFGDSGFGEAPSVAEIHALADLNSIKLPESPMGTNEAGPYWIFRSRDRQDVVIFDRGETAAKDLPAHGHCDLTGLEASIAGQRWFVDSGNYHYEDDSMRHYCRSSLAHNVATINRDNQSEVWSKFRMGNRGRMVATAAGNQGDVQWATATVQAYPQQGVDELIRLLAIRPESQDWICSDLVKWRSTTSPVIAFLHLSPHLNLDATENPNRFQIADENETRWISFFNVANVQVADSWYCPAFGERQRNLAFEYECEDRKQPFGWCLTTPNRHLEIQTSESTLSCTDDQTSFFDWNF